MDPQVALWILGAAVVPWLGWCIHITWLTLAVLKRCDRLVSMLESPEAHGFGTVVTNRSLEANTRAVKQLTHYVKWLAKAQSNDPNGPPPYTETDDGSIDSIDSD